jgi:hypothetical protein
MSAIEQAKSNSDNDCESSDDSLPEGQGKHDVVVLCVAATDEMARLVRRYWHCCRSSRCGVSVYVPVGAPVRA